MASICEVCGKGTLAGNNVSHSNRHTKRAWKPNIQQVSFRGSGVIRIIPASSVIRYILPYFR